MSKSSSVDIPLPEQSYYIEIIVGIFVLIGILGFGYLAVNIAGIRIFSSGSYPVRAEFDNVSGLKLGAPAEIAGVPVGEVVKIELNGTSALVSLEIRDGVVLRDDDIAAIRTKGIIGDRYIKIMPGSSETGIKSAGAIAQTESAVEFEEIIGKFIHRME